MESDDRRLWARARTGDEDAFATLFDRYADRLYNYCFRATADWSAAEELVSMVFLEAWRRRSDLELTSREDRLLPWLLGVATNLIRRRRRTAARLARALLRLDRRAHEPDFADDALARVDDERRMARVLWLVRALSDGEREALALYAWAGLTYEEVALALGVPVGTVRSRLSRARAHLKPVAPGATLRTQGEVTNESR